MIHHGDCLEVMAGMEADSIDACVTDPPYGLKFMGRDWDHGVPGVPFWTAALRVLKPGAHLLAFGGARTFHRVACAIEDAGFEIRDTVMWVYGTGFPKSRNQHGEWEGWGTALKPAFEPICIARKPLAGTVADNLAKHGTGAINIDGCRVAFGDEAPSAARRAQGAPSSCRPGEYGRTIVNRTSHERWEEPRPGEQLGRWPANLCHDGSDEVVALFPADRPSGGHISRRTAPKSRNTFGDLGCPPEEWVGYPDTGSAARFFYCPKASRSDRGDGNTHPTVKPTDFMRWLCRLVTPPGGLILDPFAGSGSTGKAAILEGFRFVGIERESEYIPIAEARIAAAEAHPRSLFGAG